ncbi:MAG: thioredoxin [Gammaproteobacteria bacterium]|nr:thioredoxin [Gammaproteobacteria bacterium]
MNDFPFIFSVTQEDFVQRVLENSRQVPVIVDFWADWCGPCHMLMPILTKLAQEYQGQFLLAKVNSDEQQTLALQYGVRSLPTVKFFKDGNVVDEFMGIQQESAIRQLLERHIERESDKIRLQAEQALEANDTEKALLLLQQAIALDPMSSMVKITMAQALMQTGESERAEILLDDLQGEDREKPKVKSLKARLAFARIAAETPDNAILESTLSLEPDNLRVRYQLSAQRIISGDYEAAMDHLFEIMRRDRKFENDAGRKGLLSVFEILGDKDKLVPRYRSKMFNILH